MKKDYLLDLIKLKNTVFTAKDISLFWQETDVNFIKKKIYRYLKADKIYSIRRGIYVKNKDYSRFELATKIYTPAYISFETVLAKAGVTFQFYNQIFAASYLTRNLSIDNQDYCFKKIKNSVLTNKTGIEIKDGYFIASPERAFLDVVYLNKDYYFDNLSGLDWNKIFDILPIYGNNKRIRAAVLKYQNAAKNGLN